MEQKINILLVDDHELLTDGLKSLLATQSDFCVVASAKNATEALNSCQDNPELDLILMDIALPGSTLNGLELTRKIKKDFPKIKVLVCSVNEADEYVQHAKQVGANGYITKSASGMKTVDAIRQVIKEHESWPLNGSLTTAIQERPTPTEMEVLSYIDRGMTTAQIAVELAMLETTVSANRYNIKRKYGLRTQPQLVKFARKCMELYGMPPDPELSVELDNHMCKFKAQTNIEVNFSRKAAVFNNATNRALSRVTQESLRNVRQHASASRVAIQLDSSHSSWITLAICDDGKGFDVAQLKSELKGGIDALKRILAAIGGELIINSSRNNGTTVKAILRRTMPC
jgi:two-component system, NarL family, nitrate/nitrite response regulator NarL